MRSLISLLLFPAEYPDKFSKYKIYFSFFMLPQMIYTDHFLKVKVANFVLRKIYSFHFLFIF
jgi:hypothetical protein